VQWNEISVERKKHTILLQDECRYQIDSGGGAENAEVESVGLKISEINVAQEDNEIASVSCSHSSFVHPVLSISKYAIRDRCARYIVARSAW